MRRMSIAQELSIVSEEFIEPCPFCSQPNRMVVKGVRHGNERELYPDMGYYFCNCKNFFYSRFKDITKDVGLHSKEYPLENLKETFKAMEDGETLCVVMPDIFFVDWQQDPYEFLHWDPRTTYTLWNIDQFCDEAEAIGFKVLSAEHDFNVDSDNPQTFKIVLKKKVSYEKSTV